MVVITLPPGVHALISPPLLSMGDLLLTNKHGHGDGISLLGLHYAVQADLRDIVGLAPDHSTKASMALKQVT